MKLYQVRTCRHCGANFEPHCSNSVYCSSDCKRTHKSRLFAIREANREWFTRKCPYCGTGFKTPRMNQKFCSVKCRNDDWADHHQGSSSRFTIFQRDHFTCIYCGRSSIKHRAILHLDHIVPESSGGQSIAANLITACKECNLAKGDRRLSHNDEFTILEMVSRRNKRSHIYPMGRYGNERLAPESNTEAIQSEVEARNG